jgi:TolB-like protein
VLPFENRSEEKANAYFAEGIQDEILMRLSKIADLKVISRTSTQHYKSAPENLPEIAKQLGVAHILEGSVQKSGDAVRVNVWKPDLASDLSGISRRNHCTDRRVDRTSDFRAFKHTLLSVWFSMFYRPAPAGLGAVRDD